MIEGGDVVGKDPVLDPDGWLNLQIFNEKSCTITCADPSWVIYSGKICK